MDFLVKLTTTIEEVHLIKDAKNAGEALDKCMEGSKIEASVQKDSVVTSETVNTVLSKDEFYKHYEGKGYERSN